MKRYLLAPLARILLSLLLCGGTALAADTPQLLKFKHNILSDSSEEVVLQFNGTYSPKVFTLKGTPPRVVFDFPDLTHGRGIQPVNEINGPLIKRIRVGRHTDDAPKTRVVFDVATLDGLKYTERVDNANSTLTILFTGSAKTAAAGKVRAGKKEDEALQATAKAAPPSPAEGIEQQTPQPAQMPPPILAAEATPDAAAPPQPEQAKTTPSGAPRTGTAAESADQRAGGGEQSDAAPAPPSAAAASPQSLPTKQTPETITPPAAEPPVPPTVDKTTAKSQAAPAGAAAGKEEKPQLLSVKFDPESPKGEMVLFQLNGFYPPTVQGVEEGIPRVICDFNNTELVDTKNSTIKTKGKYVKVLRTTRTKKPEKVRVTIDLEPHHSYDLQQVFFRDDNLFVLIVNTVKK